MSEIRRIEKKGIMYRIIKDDTTGAIFAAAAYPIYRNMTDLRIEGSVDNIPVTAIESGAFAQLPKLRRVIVCCRKTLYVEDAAFANCPNLREIHFQGDNTILGSEAFRDCPELTEVWSFHKIQLLGRNIFKSCAKKISMVADISEIGNYAFLWAPEFKTLFVADNARLHASSMVGLQADCISFHGNIELIGNASFDMLYPYKMTCKKGTHLEDLFYLGMDVVAR